MEASIKDTQVRQPLPAERTASHVPPKHFAICLAAVAGMAELARTTTWPLWIAWQLVAWPW